MDLRLSPRFAGKATLAVVGDRVHEIRTVDLSAGGTNVSLEVRPEWGAGAYVVALAHRPSIRPRAASRGVRSGLHGSPSIAAPARCRWSLRRLRRYARGEP